MDIRTKRVYDAASKDDGTRILVDRLWPRGIKKELLRADLWMKEIAPSTELRKWFREQPRDWEDFRRRYVGELDHNSDAVAELKQIAKKGRVTLLYSVKDAEYNHAVVLEQYLSGAHKTDEKVVVENVNVPGHTTRVSAGKYNAMKKALLEVLPSSPPGATQKEIQQKVVAFLPESLFPGGAKASWWAKTVQLDLEAKGVVHRENTKPLRWHK